ncbi:TadE/TadG family type IV pilus assembly protein [Pyxidicoccus sp. MSG2]|uniref:TadE/TadG family type IV pilus assembly protein n=1 Tax=Pyxidicoccus sp. MSG2 TaxID=2996790 RepID=UPI00226E8A3D|nr:TadE family protein [Pyxidicoccus sp. MSG2]MCY1017178.1 pilus assembly protein [Pyxidicoccus sp. MSG2]
MHPTRRPKSSQSGQVAVETALVVPMMIFLVLGIIQLGMVHHARLMTEYGAYRAVRAGIVNHGDCGIMERAALVALTPTLGPLKGMSGRVDTIEQAVNLNEAYALVVLGPGAPPPFYPAGPLPLLRVQVVNPRASQLISLFNTYGSHMRGQEIDYDDIRDDQVIGANLLSVRLTYFYELRIPFANWQLHSFYMGREYLDELRGIQFENKRVGGQSATRYLERRGAERSEDHKSAASLAESGRYVMPLVATWSMRMQSNYLNNPRHGPGRCATDN